MGAVVFGVAIIALMAHFNNAIFSLALISLLVSAGLIILIDARKDGENGE